MRPLDLLSPHAGARVVSKCSVWMGGRPVSLGAGRAEGEIGLPWIIEPWNGRISQTGKDPQRSESNSWLNPNPNPTAGSGAVLFTFFNSSSSLLALPGSNTPWRPCLHLLRERPLGAVGPQVENHCSNSSFSARQKLFGWAAVYSRSN